MTLFVDTSALYALLDEDSTAHPAAAATLARMVEQAERLLTHNYVAVETSALVQRRLGMAAARRLHEDVLPAVRLVWIEPSVHRAAQRAWLAAGLRGVSLVDWVSFEVMSAHDLGTAFAFDADFARRGFSTVP